jgi:hypothetical protein
MATDTATTYDLAERAEEQRIAALARALVTELGDAWSVKPADDDGRMHYGRLVGPQGMALYIHGAGWAGTGRLSVSGDYPRRDSNYYGPREGRAKATIAAERAQGDTLAKAAREIVSRMFNHYREQYAKALAQAEAHDAYQSKAEQNAAKMRAALGDIQSDSQYTRSTRGFYINMTGQTYGSGDCGDDSVRFDRLSTSVEKALRIAAILAEPEVNA